MIWSMVEECMWVKWSGGGNGMGGGKGMTLWEIWVGMCRVGWVYRRWESGA